MSLPTYGSLVSIDVDVSPEGRTVRSFIWSPTWSLEDLPTERELKLAYRRYVISRTLGWPGGKTKAAKVLNISRASLARMHKRGRK